MTKKIFALFAVCAFMPSLCLGEALTFQQKILNIVSGKHADIALAVMGPGKRNMVSINDDHPMPMQSVYKFHLALAILDMVDKGKLHLDQKILVSRKDLHEGTHSPLKDKYPEGNVYIPLEEILLYTVSESDNNGCDILFKTAGGTEKVNDYIRSLGIDGVNISATEYEMHKSPDIQYSNSSTSLAAVFLLEKFYSGGILSENSRQLLLGMMAGSATGEKRIKALLPKDTPVAHKTGSGPKIGDIITACNDIGIVMLPDGKYFTIAVFISDSEEDNETNEKIIADIAKAAWDNFTK